MTYRKRPTDERKTPAFIPGSFLEHYRQRIFSWILNLVIIGEPFFVFQKLHDLFYTDDIRSFQKRDRAPAADFQLSSYLRIVKSIAF